MNEPRLPSKELRILFPFAGGYSGLAVVGVKAPAMIKLALSDDVRRTFVRYLKNYQLPSGISEELIARLLKYKESLSDVDAGPNWVSASVLEKPDSKIRISGDSWQGAAWLAWLTNALMDIVAKQQALARLRTDVDVIVTGPVDVGTDEARLLDVKEETVTTKNELCVCHATAHPDRVVIFVHYANPDGCAETCLEHCTHGLPTWKVSDLGQVMNLILAIALQDSNRVPSSVPSSVQAAVARALPESVPLAATAEVARGAPPGHPTSEGAATLAVARAGQSKATHWWYWSALALLVAGISLAGALSSPADSVERVHEPGLLSVMAGTISQVETPAIPRDTFLDPPEVRLDWAIADDCVARGTVVAPTLQNEELGVLLWAPPSTRWMQPEKEGDTFRFSATKVFTNVNPTVYIVPRSLSGREDLVESASREQLEGLSYASHSVVIPSQCRKVVVGQCPAAKLRLCLARTSEPLREAYCEACDVSDKSPERCNAEAACDELASCQCGGAIHQHITLANCHDKCCGDRTSQLDWGDGRLRISCGAARSPN